MPGILWPIILLSDEFIQLAWTHRTEFLINSRFRIVQTITGGKSFHRSFFHHRRSAQGQKQPFSQYDGNDRFRGYSVAKLFSGCRIVIIESLYQMKRIILTEIGTATNQCYAKFPWTEFCNRIPSKADIGRTATVTIFSPNLVAILRWRHRDNSCLRTVLATILRFRLTALPLVAEHRQVLANCPSAGVA